MFLFYNREVRVNTYITSRWGYKFFSPSRVSLVFVKLVELIRRIPGALKTALKYIKKYRAREYDRDTQFTSVEFSKKIRRDPTELLI